MHSLACTNWRKIDSALQTYDAFQVHFTKYEVDRRLIATSENHGFAANSAAASNQANLIAAAVQAAVRLAIQPLQAQLARANLAAADPRAHPPAQGGPLLNSDAIAALGPNYNYC
jgi:hypothetical protein